MLNQSPFYYFLMVCCLAFACHTQQPSSGSKKESVTSPGKRSIVQKLKESDHLPVEKRLELYHELKKDSAAVYDFTNETELTLYGYSRLWDNQMTEAISIFKLIVAEFPESSNAFDSMAEAYLKNGDSALAKINYQQSVRMNPGNFNAIDQIELIDNPALKRLSPAQKFPLTYPVAQYRADLDQLGTTLLKIHSNPLKFITRDAFWKVVEQKKALITPATTFGEFSWHCSEIIASLHCSHTDLGSFYMQNDMLPPNRRFPLRTRWVSNKLYIVDAFSNSDKVAVADQIESINGRAVSEILEDVYQHTISQGFIQTTKQHFFNQWSSALLSYSLGMPENYTIVIKGKGTSIALRSAGNITEPFTDPSIKRCAGNLCIDIINDKTAVLTIASFVYYPWANFPVFTRFIDSSFALLQEKNIKNLVIDVRFNGGGSQYASIHLLRYLAAKPFIYYSRSDYNGKGSPIHGEEMISPFNNRFKGNVYYLIDGIGNSTTGHFMSLVKVLQLGTIIGEELGSNQFCSAGQTICRLTNTRLEYYVADNTHITTATSLPDEKGILPDHYVSQTIHEYFSNTDAVKNFTLRMIDNK